MGRLVPEADGDFSGFTGFRTVGIVGLGLIGGSLALAIRERWPAAAIVGVDRPEVLAEARDRHIVSHVAADPRALAHGDFDRPLDLDRHLDLVILAAPVLQNIACLDEIAGAISRPLLVTDVGSTKEAIVSAAHHAAAASPHLTFIGGHPIAGAAHAGLAHARADLFRGRRWIFTPASGASYGRSLATLRAFVQTLGAEPALLDAAEHDRVMAYISHLPQLAASGLMRVAGEGVGASGLALSGPGLADTTRLASSPASVWTEILQSNAEHVRLALDAFIADLQAVREQLATPAAQAWLDAGAKWRDRLGRERLGNGVRID
jgi:prephenate dehydrogenase